MPRYLLRCSSRTVLAILGVAVFFSAALNADADYKYVCTNCGLIQYYEHHVNNIDCPNHDRGWMRFYDPEEERARRKLFERHMTADDWAHSCSVGTVEPCRYAEVIETEGRKIAWLEKHEGRHSENILPHLEGIRVLYEFQKRYSDAEAIAKKEVAINTALHGANSYEVAGSLYHLGRTYFRRGMYAESEACQVRCVELEEKTKGPRYIGVAMGLETLAEIYQHTGRSREAEDLLRRAAAIRGNPYYSPFWRKVLRQPPRHKFD